MLQRDVLGRHAVTVLHLVPNRRQQLEQLLRPARRVLGVHHEVPHRGPFCFTTLSMCLTRRVWTKFMWVQINSTVVASSIGRMQRFSMTI